MGLQSLAECGFQPAQLNVYKCANLVKLVFNAFLQHSQFLRRNYSPLVNVCRLVIRVIDGVQKTAVANHEQSCQQTRNVLASIA